MDGTKGAYQIGVWKALEELGIAIKAISGASIGSINGALMLQGNIDKAIDLYKNIKINDIMEINDKIDTSKDLFDLSNMKAFVSDFTKNKGIDNTPLRETINKYIDVDKIYKSKIDFGLVTYSVKDKKPLQVFKNEIPKEEMVDYLLASSCFPIFKAQKIGNDSYMDGGLYDNVPINMLTQKGYKNIIVADINGIGFSRKMIDKDVYLKVISPKENLGGIFEFNHERISNNIILGYLDTMKSFNKMQGHIYYFFSKEFNKMLEVFNLQTISGLENAAKIYKMDKYKAYNFKEFIQELHEKHINKQKEYLEVKKTINIKNILNIKENINTIFNGGFGVCFAYDVYMDKPMSKKFSYLKHFIEDYLESAISLIELENYIK